MHERRSPADLSEEERQQLHRAHQSLRNASNKLEELTATEPDRGRWPDTPAPPEILEAAQRELQQACQTVWSTQRNLLGLEPPDSSVPDSGGQ